jgi:hypothetical protein
MFDPAIMLAYEAHHGPGSVRRLFVTILCVTAAFWGGVLVGGFIG